MFLRGTYNYAVGYAKIQIEGYFVERFINLCMNRNIEVWDITRLYDGIITLKIKNHDLSKIDEIANITKSNVTVLEQKHIETVLKQLARLGFNNCPCIIQIENISGCYAAAKDLCCFII